MMRKFAKSVDPPLKPVEGQKRSSGCRSSGSVQSHRFYLTRDGFETWKHLKTRSMALHHIHGAKSALFPITLIGWFVGIGIIEYPVGHLRMILGLLYSSMIYTGYVVCAVFCYLTDEQRSWIIKYSFLNVSYYVSFGLHVIVVGFVIVARFVDNKERNRCITELDEINGIMEGMGVVCSYKRISVSQIWQFGCLAGFMIVFGMNSESCSSQQMGIMGRWMIIARLFFELFPYYTFTVNVISFCNFNAVITASFEDLNSLLKFIGVKRPCDSHDMENNLTHVDAVLKDVRKIEVLDSVRKIYKRLAHVAERWNKINAKFILFDILTSTVLYTFQIFIIYKTISSAAISWIASQRSVHSILVTILLTGRLFMIVHTAVSLTSEAHHICGILLEHLHPLTSIRTEVRTFSMQLIQSPLRLSVFGLYPLDYSILKQILASVITYSIMFIQTVGPLPAVMKEY